ncbi:MAG: hypothetical protein EOM87_00875 [Clostridia bacterium]|nr:hypothetical protein [Clostridia bacterium]
MKLWAKIICGEKLRQNIVMVDKLPLTRANYETFLMEICHQLDISTPVTLPTHFRYLDSFNIVKYLPRDFIERVDFDFFTIENIGQ